MPPSQIVLLYVADPATSAAFYEPLLGSRPVEQAPTFAMFVLPSGLGLGLWRRTGVEPAADAPPGGSEIGFRVDTPAEVDETHASWAGHGARIAQPPTEMDFGRTFLALDPDGHRLRVYAAAPEG